MALPPREVVDEELAKHAVPVAPTAEVLEALGSGASAAVDVGMFPVARNLLALRLRYRPDDAPGERAPFVGRVMAASRVFALQ